MTDIIERAKAALEGATEAPWFVHDFADPLVSENPDASAVTVSCDHPAHITVASMGGGRMGSRSIEQAQKDARFIADARQLVPELIAEVERLRAALADKEAA